VPPKLVSDLLFLEICDKELDGKFKELSLNILLSVYAILFHLQCLRWGLRLS
jgi:hypothetical protein